MLTLVIIAITSLWIFVWMYHRGERKSRNWGSQPVGPNNNRGANHNGDRRKEYGQLGESPTSPKNSGDSLKSIWCANTERTGRQLVQIFRFRLPVYVVHEYFRALFSWFSKFPWIPRFIPSAWNLICKAWILSDSLKCCQDKGGQPFTCD